MGGIVYLCKIIEVFRLEGISQGDLVHLAQLFVCVHMCTESQQQISFRKTKFKDKVFILFLK